MTPWAAESGISKYVLDVSNNTWGARDTGCEQGDKMHMWSISYKNAVIFFAFIMQLGHVWQCSRLGK